MTLRLFYDGFDEKFERILKTALHKIGFNFVASGYDMAKQERNIVFERVEEGK